MRRVFAALSLVAVLVGVACSSTLRADDYDRSCVADDDCVTVSVGDVCDCACEQGAVSKRGEAKYREDRADISCSNQCKPCFSRDVPVCVEGTCHARRCEGSVKYCTTACGQPSTLTACTCPAGMVDITSCSSPSPPADGGAD